MKYLLVLISFLFITVAFGQSTASTGGVITFSEKPAGFNISKVETGDTFMGYELFTTNSGSPYVEHPKKNGVGVYNLWIGSDTGIKHGTHQVRQFKSGSYCYFTKLPNGRLKKVGLKVD